MTAELGFVATNDLVGITRGRGMPLVRLEDSLDTGCGWVPANLGIGPFGAIVGEGEVFGSTGDLRLIPDPSTRTEFPTPAGAPPLTVMLGDTVNIDLTPWAACPRTFLRTAVADLAAETGLHVYGAFEHEFMLVTDDAPPAAFSLDAMLGGEPWGSGLVEALTTAGIEVENWLPEYGANQWEVVVPPALDTEIADRAVLLRDIVRQYSKLHGKVASFSPLLDPDGSGNGVHLHVSLRNGDGVPVTFDATRPGRMSEVAGQFAAGILQHCRAITALTASSVVSYQRLTPHRWSAGHAFLGEQNREAMLRICPLVEVEGKNRAAQYNIEYRAGDATSNPWLYLGCIVRAGLEGIRRQLPAPRVLDVEVDSLTPAEREAAGVRTLPASLAEALAALAEDEVVTGWFDPELLSTFVAIKREEIATAKNLSDAEICAAYRNVY